MAASAAAVAVAAVGAAAVAESDRPRMTIRSTALDSGLRVVTEAMPELRSVALGYWAVSYTHLTLPTIYSV